MTSLYVIHYQAGADKGRGRRTCSPYFVINIIHTPIVLTLAQVKKEWVKNMPCANSCRLSAPGYSLYHILCLQSLQCYSGRPGLCLVEGSGRVAPLGRAGALGAGPTEVRRGTCEPVSGHDAQSDQDTVTRGQRQGTGRQPRGRQGKREICILLKVSKSV